ncbi:MAG: YHYH domain-containing protein [Methylococcaceae bacterium]
MKKVILIGVIAFFSALNANAHSGGTDSQGCHIDHRTGLRHCH